MTLTEKWKNYFINLFNTPEDKEKAKRFVNTSVDSDYIEQMKAISNIEKLKGLANYFKECEENG